MKRKPKKRIQKRRLSVNRRLLNDIRHMGYQLSVARGREIELRLKIVSLTSQVEMMQAKQIEFRDKCVLATVRPVMAERYRKHRETFALSIVMQPMMMLVDFQEGSRKGFQDLEIYCAQQADDVGRKLHMFLSNYFREKLGH